MQKLYTVGFVCKRVFKIRRFAMLVKHGDPDRIFLHQNIFPFYFSTPQNTFRCAIMFRFLNTHQWIRVDTIPRLWGPTGDIFCVQILLNCSILNAGRMQRISPFFSKKKPVPHAEILFPPHEVKYTRCLRNHKLYPKQMKSEIVIGFPPKWNYEP